MKAPGCLTVLATPIGNLGDLTQRAEQALKETEVWLAEDTRVSGKLASALGVKPSLRRLDANSSDAQLQRVVNDLLNGEDRLLVSDAGTPAISDPGARLVDLCREADIPVVALPGPSAVTLALSASGFYAQRFVFLGYLGRKRGDIIKELLPFSTSTLSIVVFESPFRVRDLLEASSEALGSRRYAICRELTKMHEQVFRATLPDLPNEDSVPMKGEFTIVFEGHRR